MALLAAGRLVFSHFIKISTSGLPAAVQLYLLTLGDPSLQEDSLPARGSMLRGLPGLHLGSRGGPQPAHLPRKTASPSSPRATDIIV